MAKPPSYEYSHHIPSVIQHSAYMDFVLQRGVTETSPRHPAHASVEAQTGHLTVVKRSFRLVRVVVHPKINAL